jgi:peroxiredoxin
LAPELVVSRWFNTTESLTLAGLRGRPVLLHAFQMLCPGCAQQALPQLTRIQETFSTDDVMVLGLHTVFEHHAAQGSREALTAFLHEYRYTFPVGIDRPSDDGGLPRTMAAYAMQGTPTMLLIDRGGRLRRQAFGHVPDLRLGAEIMALATERAP